MVTNVDSTPAGTVTVAGGVAAGLELDNETTAPPGGAWPFSITMPPIAVPLVLRTGNPSRPLSDDGLTVNVCVVDSAPMLAVIVTEVGVSTCPVQKRNCTQDVLPCTGTVAGNGATDGFELERLMVPPPGGTFLFSWRST
jgi:hypothetical protein